MPRFAILEHDWPVRHWDLLLESRSILRAWRLLAEPLPGMELPTHPNFDHRLIYLDYEGPLSGGRGSVRRWDTGVFQWVVDQFAKVEVQLHGEKLLGRLVIVTDSLGRTVSTFLTEPAA